METGLPASPPPAARAALHLHHLPCPPSFPLGKVGQVQVRREQPEFIVGANQRGFARRGNNCAHLRCFIAQAKGGAGKGCGGKTGRKPSACSSGHLLKTAQDHMKLELAVAEARQSSQTLQEECNHRRHKFGQFLFSASTQLQANRVQVNRNDLIII